MKTRQMIILMFLIISISAIELRVIYKTSFWNSILRILGGQKSNSKAIQVKDNSMTIKWIMSKSELKDFEEKTEKLKLFDLNTQMNLKDLGAMRKVSGDTKNEFILDLDETLFECSDESDMSIIPLFLNYGFKETYLIVQLRCNLKDKNEKVVSNEANLANSEENPAEDPSQEDNEKEPSATSISTPIDKSDYNKEEPIEQDILNKAIQSIELELKQEGENNEKPYKIL